MDIRYSRRFVCGGNETATFSSVIAQSTDAISGFYRELALECERWCEEHLASLEEYRKRGCRAARYVFEASEIAKTESEVDIRLRVYISRGAGDIEILFDETHRWSTAGVAMLLRDKRREKAKKSAKALKKIKNIEKSS